MELQGRSELPIKLYRDNKAATNISPSQVQQDGAKHVKVDIHFIKEKMVKRIICMTYVATKEQTADVFTKLQQDSEKFITRLGLVNI